MKSAFLASLMALAIGAQAQAGAWGQCGGIGWTGATTCVSGYTCVKGNDYYYQCLPGAASTTSTTSNPPTTSTTSSTTVRPTTTSVTTTTPVTTSTTTSAPQPTGTSGTCTGVTKFKYYGVNQAGAEFGNNVVPGLLGTHYTWPTQSSIDWFVQRGFNTFRIGFLMERLSPPATGLTGGFDWTYLNDLKKIVNYTTSKGAYAVVNPHNFMRYNGAVISDTAAFKTWWTKLAAEFKDNERVIFDVNNEPHTMSVDLTFDLQQAGVDGIRAAGATKQLILISGTAWTGAWTWISSGNSARIGDVKDPSNNLAVQMHQYLDTDGSGTSPQCVSPTIGAERVKEATAWCKSKGVKCFLGELGAGSNDQCIAAVKSALCAMQQAGGVWVGALWWAAGPWWGDYYQSIEPPNGPAIARILPEALMPFM